MADYWQFELAVLRSAWYRACEAWSFKSKHIPAYLLSASSGLAVLAYWRGAAAMSAELPVIGSALAGVAFLFLLTMGWQMAVGPYRLYRASQKQTAELRKQLDVLSTPAIECFAALVEDSVETILNVANPPRIPAKYIKVGVRALSPTVRSCAPFIKAMSRHTADGSVIRAAFNDPMPLRWSSHTAFEVDVQSVLPRYFDVLSCSKQRDFLSLCGEIPRPVKLMGFFKEQGTYSINIVVVSRDSQAHPEIEILVDWKGSWETVTASIGKVPERQYASAQDSPSDP